MVNFILNFSQTPTINRLLELSKEPKKITQKVITDLLNKRKSTEKITLGKRMHVTLGATLWRRHSNVAIKAKAFWAASYTIKIKLDVDFEIVTVACAQNIFGLRRERKFTQLSSKARPAKENKSKTIIQCIAKLISWVHALHHFDFSLN